MARARVATMGLLLRAAIMLAVTVPLFVATGFHLLLWQIFVAAAISSAAGQLAWRATKARPRGVQLSVIGLGLAVAAGGAVAVHFRTEQTPGTLGLIVVANGTPRTLTHDDLEALRPTVGGIAPLARQKADLSTEDNTWQTTVSGTTPAYFELRRWRPASGALFTQEALDQRAKVVVLGATTARQLFTGADPVGQLVRIRGSPYTVVGVLASKSADEDDVALLPLPTFFAKLEGGMGKTFDGVFFISGATPEAVRAVLRERHRLVAGDDDDFVLRDLR